MSYKLYIGITTDKGKIRDKNEDNFLAKDLYMPLTEESMSLNFKSDLPGLFAICDGMGGLGHGKEASYLAVNVLNNNYHDLDMLNDNEVQNELNNLILKMNKEVYDMQTQGKSLGTTLALVYFHKDLICVANIGDSKVYEYKKGKLRQLSKDHNMAQERSHSVLQQGKYSNTNNILTQYLGMSPKEIVIEPYYNIMDYDNTMFLLCSDGLTEALSEKQIEKKIRIHRKGNLKKTTKNLVALAMKNGAKDNVTAMIIKIKEQMGLERYE